MIPAIVIFVITTIPLFYFQGQMKNFRHYQDIIYLPGNKITRENISQKAPECTKFSLDELFGERK